MGFSNSPFEWAQLKGSRMPGVKKTREWENISWWAFMALYAGTTLAIAKLPFLPDVRPVIERMTGPHFLALTLLVGIAAATWLVAWLMGNRGIRITNAHLAALAFCAAAGVSAAQADVFPLAVVGEPGRYLGWMAWMCCLVAFFLASQLVNTPVRLESLTRLVIVVGIIQATVGVMQVLGADIMRFSIPEQHGWMLAQGIGTVGNPNQFSTVLLVPFIVACGEALSAQKGTRRTVAIGAALVMAVALVAAATRGSWIGALVGVAVLAALAIRTKAVSPKAVAIGAGVLIAAVLVGILISDPAVMRTRFATDAGPEPTIEQLSNGRLRMWRQSATVFASAPVLGVGPDSIRNAFKAAGQSTGVIGVFTEDPHSLPILIAVSFGAVGLIVALWLLVSVLGPPVKRLTCDETATQDTLLRVTWFAALVGVLVASLVSVLSVLMLLALALALGVVHAPEVVRVERVRQPSLAVARGVAVAACALSLFAVVAALLPMHHNAQIWATAPSIPLSETHVTVLDSADRTLPWRHDIMTRRAGMLLQQALHEHAQGQNTESTGEGRLRKLCSHLDERVARYPGEYHAWLLRAQVHVVAAEKLGEDALAHKARSIAGQALKRFPNDPEFHEIADYAKKL